MMVNRRLMKLMRLVNSAQPINDQRDTVTRQFIPLDSKTEKMEASSSFMTAE